ncbi:VOC family protein [Actinokineospora spheciospongiae]|uniref:VOC family protein n=1 Tax=Actinokineospora spheciospongiae TaxID=909613 RepID=UPI0015E86338
MNFLDHVLLGVRDLEAAADRFRHEWGLGTVPGGSPVPGVANVVVPLAPRCIWNSSPPWMLAQVRLRHVWRPSPRQETACSPGRLRPRGSPPLEARWWCADGSAPARLRQIVTSWVRHRLFHLPCEVFTARVFGCGRR